MSLRQYATVLCFVFGFFLARSAPAQEADAGDAEASGGEAAEETAPSEGQPDAPDSEAGAEAAEEEAPTAEEDEPSTDAEPAPEPAAPANAAGEIEVAPPPAVVEMPPVPAGDEEEAPAEASEGDAGEEAAPGGHFQGRARWGNPDRVQFIFGGEHALRLVWQSDMELSAVPTDRPVPEENIMADNDLGQNIYLLNWIRLRPELRFIGRLRLIGQLDLLHGHMAGDSTHDVEAARSDRSDYEAFSTRGIRPRWLYLEWDTGYGILRAGQMGSNWGLGILANDGDHSDDYLFGDHRYGDVVERLVFATKPFYRTFSCIFRHLLIALGGDLVFDDGIANILDGDIALQVVAALALRPDDERSIGLYVAYRNQTYGDGDFLRVTAIDGHARWPFRLAHGVSLYGEAEIVGIVGTTNSVPNLVHQELDVRQLGMAGRVGLRVEQIGLDVRLEGGYASGDGNLNDDQISRFTFDADYRVGLILFPELLGWSTARASTLAGHPDLVGEPQDGSELLPSNGAVSGAGYLYPSVRWQPLDWLEARFALLVAHATSDVLSPLETKRRGRPSSFRGGPATSRDLGLEVDLALLTRWDFDYVLIRAGIEGGWCSPGRAFDNAEGERHPDIGMVRVRYQMDW